MVLPHPAYFPKCIHRIIVYQAVAVGSHIQDKVTIGIVIGFHILFHQPADILQLVGGHTLLPEPSALDRQTGQCRQSVLRGTDFLSGTLLIGFDVGIEKSLPGVFGRIQIHHQAVGLQALDVLIYFGEGNVLVADARPGRIPSVDNQRRYLAVVGQQFRQLCLNHRRMFLSVDMPRTYAMMRIQNTVVKHHLQAFGTEGIHVFAYHILMDGRVHTVVIGRLGVPDAEAAMVLGSQTAIRHMGCFCHLCPLTAIQPRRVEGRNRLVGIGPVLGRIGRNVEVDEHTEAQIHELLLQLVQRLPGSLQHITGNEQG